MAGLRIAAIAKQRNSLTRFDQRYQFVKFLLRFGFIDVFVVDAPQRIGVTAACRRRPSAGESTPAGFACS
jgi:hypothetical protein